MKPTITILLILFTLATTSSAQLVVSAGDKEVVKDTGSQTITTNHRCFINPVWENGDFWEKTTITSGQRYVGFHTDTKPIDRVKFYSKANPEATEDLQVSTQYAISFTESNTFRKFNASSFPRVFGTGSDVSDGGTFRIEETDETDEERRHYKLSYDSVDFGSGDVGLMRYNDKPDVFYVALVIDNVSTGDDESGSYTIQHLDFSFTDCVAPS